MAKITLSGEVEVYGNCSWSNDLVLLSRLHSYAGSKETITAEYQIGTSSRQISNKDSV